MEPSANDPAPQASDRDDVKRRFREALERKQGKSQEATTGDPGDHARGSVAAHGPAHTQRQFRRKSGG